MATTKDDTDPKGTGGRQHAANETAAEEKRLADEKRAADQRAGTAKPAASHSQDRWDYPAAPADAKVAGPHDEQYASKLDEIANKLPNLVGDQNALVAYAAELKAMAVRVRNPKDGVPVNPAKQPDIRPDYKTIHEDGQSAATRPTVRLENDVNAPQHLPIAVPDAASVAAIDAMHGRKDEPTENKPEVVAARTQFGTGTDTQKGAGNPGKL